MHFCAAEAGAFIIFFLAAEARAHSLICPPPNLWRLGTSFFAAEAGHIFFAAEAGRVAFFC